MRRAPALAAAGACLVLSMVPAAALVHQWSWTATGHAAGVRGLAAITVHWAGGAHFYCASEYDVTLASLEGGALAHARFRGYEDQLILAHGPLEEVFLATGGSTDPAVSFAFRAVQANLFLPVRSMNNVLLGHFEGWQFEATTLGYVFPLRPCA